MRLLFIDNHNAYDSVNRKKLYDKIMRKNILYEWELELLKFIHHNVVIKVGKYECRTTTGVPQGLKSSPSLYNIYA